MTSIFSPGTLTKRIIGAGSWSVIGLLVSYSVRLGGSLILTRLLAPRMFGVMSIAALVTTGLAMLSDLGVKQNIIRSKRGDDPIFLNTAWAVQISRSLLLWIIALLSSSAIWIIQAKGFVLRSSVYSDPELAPVISVVTFSIIITGFQSTKLYEASRRLALARVTQIQITSQLLSLLCIALWAWTDPSIWALTAGGLCSSLATTVLSHTYLPGVRNRWAWDRTAIHELFHFGKWIFPSSVMGFVANNADRLMLGGLVGSSTLGIYSIAVTIVGAVTGLLNTIIADISYSALSEVARERPQDMKRVLYRFHNATASFTYLCSGILIVSGPALVDLLYDHRYHDAGWMLQILAVSLLAVPVNLSQYALLARGQPKLFTSVIAVQVICTIIAIPVGFSILNLSGAMWGFVVGQLSSVAITLFYQVKNGLFDGKRELLLLFVLPAGMALGWTLSKTLSVFL